MARVVAEWVVGVSAVALAVAVAAGVVLVWPEAVRWWRERHPATGPGRHRYGSVARPAPADTTKELFDPAELRAEIGRRGWAGLDVQQARPALDPDGPVTVAELYARHGRPESVKA